MILWKQFHMMYEGRQVAPFMSPKSTYNIELYILNMILCKQFHMYEGCQLAPFMSRVSSVSTCTGTL